VRDGGLTRDSGLVPHDDRALPAASVSGLGSRSWTGGRLRSVALALAALVMVGGCVMSGSPEGTSEPSAGSSVTERPSPSPPSQPSASAAGLRYVALGDSYTIGTSVEPVERFPDQLVAALAAEGPTLDLVANLATNGYTTRDVIDIELPALDTYDPEFVTLLIGVNDVVQAVPLEDYERNVVTILDALLERLAAERIVVLAIPEYTVTPQGANYGDPRLQRAAIQGNNAMMERLAGQRGIAYVDIYDLSLRAATDRSLVADDGLHPSGAQYALWVERLLPVVQAAVGP
jgi:acyl-CoA thioesterase-1